MKKNRLGMSDLYVSEIGLGCMSLGTNEQQAAAIIEQALEAGINFLDTADLYDFGANEEIVGKAIKGKREQIILATKVGNRWNEDKTSWQWDPSKQYIKEQVKQSLKRLQVEYIDLYQLHGGTIEDPIEETIEAFEELIEEGYIRYYGISSIRPNVIRKYVKSSNIVSVMMQYNIFDRRPEEEILDLLHKHHISAIARGPLAKGLLTEKWQIKISADGYLRYTKDELQAILLQIQQITKQPLQGIALRYSLSHPAVASVIAGASRAEQVIENCNALSAALTEEQYQQIQQLLKHIVYEDHR